MKLFKMGTMLLLLLLIGMRAEGMQLACGEYEVVGEYQDESNTLTLNPRSNGALPLFLTGPEVTNGFLASPENYYRVKIDIRRKVGDEGGTATLLSISGLALSPGNSIPTLSFKPHACL
ncbi:MAG: hypothetical protein EOP11_25425 [Proteobacteria bacterium]|nr:MAG: hypothetical protein EOP11_25425 [Pseudomonadota bacterium]